MRLRVLLVTLVAALAVTASASSATKLDAAGQNACYQFSKLGHEITTMTPAETHAALRKIYYGNGGWFGVRGAKYSSNPTLRLYGRRLLELEVSTGLSNAWLRAAIKFRDECNRFA